ncbi:DUF4349 domain-containing protein [Streptomyces sp. M10(2022)]
MHTGLRTDSHPPAHRPGAALAAGLLVVLLGVAGCGAGTTAGTARALGRPAGGGRPGCGPPVLGREQSADRPGDGSKAADKASAAPEPGTAVATHVIRTATLDVEVKSVRKAVTAARGVASSAGGWSPTRPPSASTTTTSSHLVLRVPQDRYDSVLRSLAGSGKLLSRTSNAKDVTGEVVDVESRIATQRASVARSGS